MIHKDVSSNTNNNSLGSNVPLSEANAESSKSNFRSKIPGEDKIRDYGKKSMGPLVDLIHKYRGEVDPYFSAFAKGFKGAINALNGGQNATGEEELNVGETQSQGQRIESADKVVAKWFSDAASWFEGVREKLKTGSPEEFIDYLEAESRKNPGLMFTSSYIVGLVMGRFGKHLGRQKSSSGLESDTTGKSSSVTDDLGGQIEADNIH